MNSLKIAAALRVLALAFESDEGDASPAPAAAAEPQKRGRGRPVKGEDQPVTGVAAPAAGSTNQAATGAAAALLAGTQTTAPASAVDDPFATLPAAPVATLDEVRKALTDLRAADSQEAALAVLKTAGGGADNLTGLAPEKYGVVVAAVAVKLRIIAASKPAATPEADPFAAPRLGDAPEPAWNTGAPAEKPPTLEDVKAVIVETQKRTSQDKAQQVVMQHGGKAPNATGGEGVSLKALPEANYAATIAALKALPTTK